MKRDPKRLSGSAITTLVVAAALAAMTGCGGSKHAATSVATAPSASSQHSSDSTTASSGSAVERRFTTQADAICKRLDAELAAAAPKRLVLSEIARSAPRNAALERRAVAQLGKLTPPASLARDWKQMLALRQALADELVKLGRYAAAKDVRAIQRLATSKLSVHKKLSAIGTRDGFRYCSQVVA